MAKGRYIPRKLEKVLKKRVREFPAIFLTGPRQTGKSTLLKEAFRHFNYVSLDSPIQRELAINDPISFLEINSPPVIIDEIQYAPQLLPYIKISIDKNREKSGQFILTGSQFFPLMQGITETLAGRISINELLGFSLEEIPPKQTGTIACFKLLYKGWFPDAALGRVEVGAFYDSYIKTYLERDLRQVSTIKDLLLFQNFMELIAGRLANILNLNEIAKECGISHTTAQKWLSILASGRIIYLLRPYFKNISKRVTKRPKVYFTDTGLVSYILKYSSPEILFNSTIKGPLFETFVVMEILKYKLNHSCIFEMYFFRDSNHNEIDLIIEYGDKKILAEIKATTTPMPNHWKTLKKLLPMFNASNAYLISLYPEKIPLDKGIINIPWHSIIDIFATR